MPRIRKAEAEPYLRRVSPTRISRGPLDRGMVVIKVPLVAILSRSGTTTMRSGRIRNGKSGVADVSRDSTGSVAPISLAIADLIAERKLTPMLNLGFSVGCETASASTFWCFIPATFSTLCADLGILPTHFIT